MCEVNALGKKQIKHTVSNSATDIINKYHDVFQGLGKLKGRYHITLKEEATPSISSTRKVPFAIYQQLKEELQKMEP